jgi:hypothetical protein
VKVVLLVKKQKGGSSVATNFGFRKLHVVFIALATLDMLLTKPPCITLLSGRVHLVRPRDLLQPRACSVVLSIDRF